MAVMPAASAAEVISLVEAVTDPEIPTLSIADLGVLREVSVDASSGTVEATITPTYSGCPAMEVIARDIADAASSLGYSSTVTISHNPPWTTDWLTERGRRALEELQIAPPALSPSRASAPVPVVIGRAPRSGASQSGAQQPGAPHTGADEVVACPRCGSGETELITRFGTTACKALWRCRACGDPFDEFKAV